MLVTFIDTWKAASKLSISMFGPFADEAAPFSEEAIVWKTQM